MKNLGVKIFKKKTNTVYSFNHLSGSDPAGTTVGDPTNTVITILTTAGGPAHLTGRQHAVKLKV